MLVDYKVESSAYIRTSTFLKTYDKSFIKIKNKCGPTLFPYGTPQNIFLLSEKTAIEAHLWRYAREVTLYSSKMLWSAVPLSVSGTGLRLLPEVIFASLGHSCF